FSKLTLEKVSPRSPVLVASTFRFLKRATILLARPVHLRAHHQALEVLRLSSLAVQVLVGHQ
ncbi:hypothetical protein HAX54_031288, partial [Datura stramonium]|nr:hypothetical protein [Datura stramonium]